MTNYVCTCGASHTSFDWDESTTESFGEGCVSISDDNERSMCSFVCPSCGKELDGDAIAVVEE